MEKNSGHVEDAGDNKLCRSALTIFGAYIQEYNKAHNIPKHNNNSTKQVSEAMLGVSLIPHI